MKAPIPSRRLLRYAAMFVAAIAMMSLTQACSNDDDNNGEEYPVTILGNWTATEQTITTNIDGLEPSTTVNDHPEHQLRIKSNGEIVSEVRDVENGQWKTEYRGAWAYSAYYQALVIAPNEEERLVYYVQFSGNDKMLLVSNENSVTEDGVPCILGIATIYTRMTEQEL